MILAGSVENSLKKEAILAGSVLLSETGLGRSRHVRFPTLGSISHVSGSKLTFMVIS